MKCMGRLYIHEDELAKRFGLPDDVVITNIIHDPTTGNIEFIIRSHEPKAIYTQETNDLSMVRRVKV